MENPQLFIISSFYRGKIPSDFSESNFETTNIHNKIWNIDYFGIVLDYYVI